MKKLYRTLLLLAVLFNASLSATAAITQAQGWFESLYAQWSPVSGAADYNVYVRTVGGQYTQLDKQLVRQYPTYLRADAVGLKAGQYELKVVPVNASGTEMTGETMTTAALTVTAHDRSGFAHVGMADGIGAYKNDGTLKQGAKVIYVTANNAKTVTTDVITSDKGTKTTAVGLQNIIYCYQKGLDNTPIDIRIIGTIKKGDCDALGSSAEGLQIKGNAAYQDMPLTIEGIGNDAAIYGFGMLLRSVKGVELRNFAVILCMDDCLSLDTKNANIWIHNMDFFYGNTGGDADQAKGDGTVDIKAASKNVTLSYCHFYDSGKSSLGGMDNEVSTACHTFHHNWFDHSDSRHPRVRVQFFHVYNNYFDGVSKYGIGMTSGGSAFVENNYFRNCKYPMLISKQGTDTEGKGTFSGEPGGIIKAYNNTVKGAKKLQYYDGSQTDGMWDAVLVTSRDEAVTARCLDGGTGYNAEADQALRTQYLENHIDAPEDIPAIVKGWLGAGRMGHGDIKWTFNNSLQDENYDVIADLKSALVNYRSTLVGFADGTSIANGGATATIDGGDGKGIDPAVNDAYIPSYGGGGGTVITTGEYVIGTAKDYFWTIGTNADATTALVNDGTISFSSGSSFKPEKTVTKSDGTVISELVGSLDIAKEGGYATFYLADGIQNISFYLARTGSMSGKIMGSDDGTTFTDIQSYSTKTAGILELNIAPTSPYKYIRITNASGGSLNIQGIKIAKPGNGTGGDNPPGDEKSSDASAQFTIDGEAVNISGTYTMSLAYNDPATDIIIGITPADKASVKTVTGATTQSATTYAITAPAAGETTTATFTIMAENGYTTKTYTVKVTRGVDPSTLPDTEICSFNASTKTPSKSNVSVSGNYSNSKGSVTHDGQEYTDCVKIESATNITITPDYDCNVILVFDATASGKKLKLDGQTQVTDASGRYSFTGVAGQTYTLTKGDTMNLFLIIFEKTTTGISTVNSTTFSHEALYTIDGRRIASPHRGQIVVKNGVKYVHK